MHHLGVSTLALSGVILVAAGACRTEGRAASANPEPLASGAKTFVETPRVELPANCVTFLAQLQCRLRAAGNETATIDRALGAFRASFETRLAASDLQARCQNEVSVPHVATQIAGCDGVVGRLADLPPTHPADCPSGEFFFVRRDGRVAGCHRDCIQPGDCPSASSCTAVGSAPGGPTEEPFCE